jgi:2-polyprenyl-3-methyl-5-hydroxy-6-metoxy-1,4-benzoquinol methylase
MAFALVSAFQRYFHMRVGLDHTEVHASMNRSAFVTRESCPACRASKRNTLYVCGFLESPLKEYLEAFYTPQGTVESDYLIGAKFILDECSNCGLIYQREIPNDFLMERLYEEWIDPQKSFDKYLKKQDAQHYAKCAHEVGMLLAYFGTAPDQLKFLDFGMGWGYWARIAQASGCHTYGTELSVTRVKHAMSHGINVITWDEIPIHRFDFINTEQVFEHLPEPLATLSYLKSVLKPTGLLKISVPNGIDIRRRLQLLDWSAPKGAKNSLNAVSPLEHINCFNHNVLVRYLLNK